MKLSIWQQFSSNHSSRFTIVGEFDSRTDAEKAAVTIRDILKRIADWNAAHHNDEGMDDFWNSGDWWEKPTPIEQEIADEYGITWPGAIDWFRDPKIDIVLDHLLFIQPGSRPETAGQPFEQLINKLGGRGYLEGDVYGDTVAGIIFDLTCIAPDEATADTLYREYLGFNRRIQRDNLRLHFYRWRFDQDPEFLTLIDELREANCSAIEYRFTQLPRENWNELHNEDDLEIMLDILEIGTDSWDQINAIHLLSEFQDKRAVEPLIVLLQSPDAWLRRAAASALSKFGDPRAVEPLIKLLSNSDILTKPVVISALGRINDSRAVPPLIEILHDATMWTQAANSLGQLGEIARPFLQNLLNTSDQILKSRVSTALQRIDETVKGGDLLAALRSPQEDKRHTAFEHLKQQPGAIEILLAYLRNPGNAMDNWLEDQVIDALIASSDARVVKTLADSFPNIGTKAINALTKIGAAATDMLIQMYQSTSEIWIRQTVLGSLSYIADARLRHIN